MEFDQLLRKRRNVYGFLPQEVPSDKLIKILENSTHVPSAGFTQDFDFIVVRDSATIKKMASASLQEEYNKVTDEGFVRDFLVNAPVIVVPCANKKRFELKYGAPAKDSARLPWWLIDAGFASFAFILSAFQEGLSASFIGALEDERIVDILGLPRDRSIVPLAVIPLGYEHPKSRESLTGTRRKDIGERRRRLDEVVHWEKW
jgi:nitroreductase